MLKALQYSIRSYSSAMGKFSGKVAIVTASTEGIGYAIAERLAKEGAEVMVSSRKQANVDSAVKRLTASNLKVAGVVCHVGKDDHRKLLIDETIKKFGKIDVLVSNAAVNPTFGNFLDTTDDQWDKMFDINLKAAFNLSKDVVPYMEKQGGGSIILVSSFAGYNPVAGISAYGVTKTALLGLTKALAGALGDKNVRVNCIAPGIIKTKFSEVLTSSGASDFFLQSLPIKRVGMPEECAGTVAFLASDDASYITGETIVIAGGHSCRL